LLGSQLYALKGDKKKSQDMLNIVSDTLSTYGEVSIEIEIEIINTLIAGGEQIAAQEKIKELTTRYKDDQLSLEKLDPLLLEPISEKGKKTLALVNKKGIDAYKNMEYDTAIDYFFRVEKRYPRYLGIKLNLVQAIIGRIRKEGINDDDVNRCLSIFSVVNRYITQDNSQFNRYRQLQDMLRAISSSK